MASLSARSVVDMPEGRTDPLLLLMIYLLHDLIYQSPGIQIVMQDLSHEQYHFIAHLLLFVVGIFEDSYSLSSLCFRRYFEICCFIGSACTFELHLSGLNAEQTS